MNLKAPYPVLSLVLDHFTLDYRLKFIVNSVDSTPNHSSPAVIQYMLWKVEKSSNSVKTCIEGLSKKQLTPSDNFSTSPDIKSHSVSTSSSPGERDPEPHVREETDEQYQERIWTERTRSVLFQMFRRGVNNLRDGLIDLKPIIQEDALRQIRETLGMLEHLT